MYIRVTRAGASVEDVDNFRQLHVELRVDPEVAAQILPESGLGTLDGDDAWLDIPTLRKSGHDTDPWRTDFDAMITYATTKGWVDSGRVRAHVVHH